MTHTGPQKAFSPIHCHWKRSSRKTVNMCFLALLKWFFVVSEFDRFGFGKSRRAWLNYLITFMEPKGSQPAQPVKVLDVRVLNWLSWRRIQKRRSVRKHAEVFTAYAFTEQLKRNESGGIWTRYPFVLSTSMVYTRCGFFFPSPPLHMHLTDHFSLPLYIQHCAKVLST